MITAAEAAELRAAISGYAQAKVGAATALNAILVKLREPLPYTTMEKAARVLSDKTALVLGHPPEEHWGRCRAQYLGTVRAVLEAVQ